MIFEILKRRWVKRQINKTINNRCISYSGNLNNVLLLCRIDEVDPEEIAMEIAKGLGIKRSDVTLVKYDHEKKTQEDPAAIILNKKSIKWLGGVENTALMEQLSKDYDLQINYYEKNRFELDLAAGSATSGIKVGLNNEINLYNDVTIDLKRDQVNSFVNELKKYLNVIQ
ncbi:MAG: hypothetical protein WBG46_03205 [Nonlabens sp.]